MDTDFKVKDWTRNVIHFFVFVVVSTSQSQGLAIQTGHVIQIQGIYIKNGHCLRNRGWIPNLLHTFVLVVVTKVDHFTLEFKLLALCCLNHWVLIWLGVTALHAAAEFGHLEVLRCLLVNGSSVQEKDIFGKEIMK